MVVHRDFFFPSKRRHNHQRVWNAGGDEGALSNRISAVNIATQVSYDTLLNLNAAMSYNSAGPGPGCIYVSEGYTGTNQDDIDKITISTMAIVNDIADIGQIRAGSGVASGPLKLWVIGGSTTSFYDDVSVLTFATETIDIASFVNDQLSVPRTRMGAVATDQKIISIGGQESGGYVTTIEGWPHSTETMADIGDLQTAGRWHSCHLADTACYCVNLAENERFTLATETTVDVNSPPVDTITETMGNGMFGTGALRIGGIIAPSINQDDMSILSFATETWVTLTETMVAATGDIGPCAGG